MTLYGGILIESALRQSGWITVFVVSEIFLSKDKFELSARFFEGKVVEISDFGLLECLTFKAYLVELV